MFVRIATALLCLGLAAWFAAHKAAIEKKRKADEEAAKAKPIAERPRWEDLEKVDPFFQRLRQAQDFLAEVVEQKRQAAQGGPSAAMQRLIQDLQEVRGQNPELVDRMIELANANCYDDFLGDGLPKLALLEDAKPLDSILKATVDGKYDG